MNKAILHLAIAVSLAWLAARTAEARVFPGGGGGGSIGPGGVALGAALRNNANNDYYGGFGDGAQVNLNYNMGFVGAPNRPAAQPMVQQNTIQNTMLAQAQSQSNAILSQRQANRDWWFQYQGQQMARQSAAGFGTAAAGLGLEGVDPSPPAVIKWPYLLQQPRFASRRAMIEAPYLRSPPGLSAPTTEDYAAMVKTIAEMKALLERMKEEGASMYLYNEADSFLDKIEAEARERSQAAAAPS
jgi:hypothetical protein